MLQRRRDLWIAHYYQRLCYHQSNPGSANLSRLRNVQTFQCWMVANVIRRIAMRHLKQELATIEIDGREDPIRRVDDGYPFDIQAATALPRRRASGDGPRWRIRSRRCRR